MADEYVAVAKELFDSWDPDAVVLDRENGVCADHTKVRPMSSATTYGAGPRRTAATRTP